MELDKLDIAYGIIIVGIIILLIDLSIGHQFGITVKMRGAQWAGIGIAAIGLTGLLIGTCKKELQEFPVIED